MDETPANGPPNVSEAPRPEREEQLHHPRIELLYRLVKIPVIRLVFKCADFSYWAAKDSFPLLVREILAFVEIRTFNSMDSAIYAAGQSQTVLAADRSACQALDWMIRENPGLMDAVPEEMARQARNNSTAVIEAVFGALKTLIDILISRDDILRKFFTILLATMYFMFMKSIELIFPLGENALPAYERIDFYCQRIEEFTQNIIESFSEVPNLIALEWNSLSVKVREELFHVFGLTLPSENSSAAEDQPDTE